MSNFTVYVSENCNGCVPVLQYIEGKDLPCEVVNVDFEETMPPPNLLVFPALFFKDRLLAYGSDIIDVLNRKLGRLTN